jgi:glycosyltransferase involved in cell wall biosynthesis
MEWKLNKDQSQETKLPRLAVIVPCYNEEAVLPETLKRLTCVLADLQDRKLIAANSYLYFVDDGSQDRTWEFIERAHATQPDRIKGIKLARNFGHQAALWAGISRNVEHSDCMITIDADLQQDETAMEEFLTKYLQGADIVFGVRYDRKTDSRFKRMTALGFYGFLQRMGVDIIKNHADYRLISKRAARAILQFEERNLFLRGLFANLGFNRDYVYFQVRERRAGDSKYTFKKMFSLCLNGITSFSTVPLRIISLLGLGAVLFAFAMSCYVVLQKITGHTVPGWASIVLAVYLLGGVQLLCLGVIGEYLGKIYHEVKRRPIYLKDRELF